MQDNAVAEQEARMVQEERARATLLHSITQLVDQRSVKSGKDRKKLILGLTIVVTNYIVGKHGLPKINTEKHKVAHPFFYGEIKPLIMDFNPKEEERDTMFGRVQFWLSGQLKEITGAALRKSEADAYDAVARPRS